MRAAIVGDDVAGSGVKVVHLFLRQGILDDEETVLLESSPLFIGQAVGQASRIHGCYLC